MSTPTQKVQMAYNQPLNPGYDSPYEPDRMQGQYQQAQYGGAGYTASPPPSYPQAGYQPASYGQAGYGDQGYTQPAYPQQPAAPYTPYAQNQQPAADPYASYDPYNIQYHQMSVNQWSQVPNDQSAYSQYWAAPDAFEPQTVSKNMHQKAKCNDVFWVIFFLANFAATIALCAFCGIKFKDLPATSESGTSEIATIPTSTLLKMGGIALGVAILANVLHYCYATFASLIYIKWGMFIGTVLSILFVIVPMLQGVYGFVAFPIFTIVFSVIFYCVSRKYFELSAAVLKKTTQIICKYPSIIVLMVLETVIQVVLSGGFIFMAYCIQCLQWSPWIYIYVLFSYFWITITVGYVVYMTCCGLGATWYFLNDTEYFPKHPVWESFKRASTTSLGSAAIAGFLLAIIQTLKALAQSGNGNSNGKGAAALAILKCIAMCILACLESCIKWINRYALIYCAIYGVPFTEGCRRWTELSCKKFCNVLVSGCVINNCLTYNFLLFTVGAAILGYGLGCWLVKDETNVCEIITCVVTAALTLAIFAVLEEPIRSISDTLLVCFCEAPQHLESSASDLYRTLADYYGDAVNKKVNKLL